MRGSRSAPTARALDVIEFLAEQRGAPRGSGNRFSDVVRELSLTQATAHAILKTLCDRGWAVRDPVDKTFTVGPALASAAARSGARAPLTNAARAAAVQLCAQYGYPASVVERFDQTLVITAYEHGRGARTGAAVGDRIPYAPPFGVGFAAWDTPQAQQAWIGRGAAGNAALAHRLAAMLHETRQRGYDVDRTTLALAEAAQLVGTLRRDGLPAHVREITDRLLSEFTTAATASTEVAADAPQFVATIAAPVHDARGVALIVCVHPPRPITAADVETIGRDLTQSAATLSAHEGMLLPRKDSNLQPFG